MSRLARPNLGKTKAFRKDSIPKRYHKDLVRLLDAWRMVRINDGQKFAHKASDAEISKDFVEHYWRMVEITKIGRQMLKCYRRSKKY